MPIRSLDPKSAHAEMQKAAGHTFLDVRTVEEFDAGHPAGAVNVPWALRDPAGGMAPNPDFVPAVKKSVASSARIYASCLGGVRSLNALRALEAAGYTDLVNVDTGWGGRKDPSGRIVAPGWKDCALPVASERSTYGKAQG
jgi:rhodanese-related sulfurtransferase